MDNREKQFLPPKNWTTFEDLCHELFRSIWNDPYTEKNGRRGQAQSGVDVFGSPNCDYTICHGVQCKGKDAHYGSTASIDELEREIGNAETFTPPLQHWIYATTAPVDVELQEAARTISRTRGANGRFTVTVLGWRDIESLLDQHRDVFKRFYPEHAFDIASLLASVQAMDQSARELLELSRHPVRLAPSWRPVTFTNNRDLGPAIAGRPLGPSDAAACPQLPEVETSVALLRNAYSVRIIGEPGAGKSVGAYQVALRFASDGWAIVRLDDPRTSDISLKPLEKNRRTLFIVDDAHLTDPRLLRAAEETTTSERLLLSTHNAVASDSSVPGAVFIDAKRAVRTIASGLLANRSETLAVVQRIDDRVGEGMMGVSLEDRIAEAEEVATVPWQFCFIFGGGWRRANQAADAARAKGADITLAGAAIHQLVSRDARPDLDQLSELLRSAGLTPKEVFDDVGLLVGDRLLIGMHDLRCPHQRFALVVLDRILQGQTAEGRDQIGRMLAQVVADDKYPLAGLVVLLRELYFASQHRQWTHLFPRAALLALVERAWKSTTPEDRNTASLLFSALQDYFADWPSALLEGKQRTLAEWISHPHEPSGFGLSWFINAVRGKDESLAVELITRSDAAKLARELSMVTPGIAHHLGELLSALWPARETAWSDQLRGRIDRSRFLHLARDWPAAEPIYPFAKFCHAVGWLDEELMLNMVEEFIPNAQYQLARDPVATMQELNEITMHVLRVVDPLGVYVGKHAPTPRRRSLAKTLMKKIDPTVLGQQLSMTPLRHFQSMSFLLTFMAQTLPSKFRATVANVDWKRIGRTIGKSWRNVPHDAEVLLGVAAQAKESRPEIVNLIRDSLSYQWPFPPRFAVIGPGLAIEHAEHGGLIELEQYGHIEWYFGAYVIELFARERPALLDGTLRPSEAGTGRAFSGENHTWYREAGDYVRALAKHAPQSLERILDAVDVAKAQIGWPDALAHGGGARKTVALLIEASVGRPDALGDLAKRLRSRFRRASVPRT